MSVDALHQQLRALPGVAEVEIDAATGAPAQVRIKLLPEADPEQIGADVQQILAAHGMKSRLSEAESTADVVRLPVPSPAVAPHTAEPPTVRPDAAGPSPSEEDFALPSLRSGLASVTVEETEDGVAVVATSRDGRRISQRTTASDEAVTAAIVAVVGTLVEGAPPRLLGVFTNRSAGSEVVTVVLQRGDGTRVAGAAIVGVGRSYAVARAAWLALSG